MHIHGIATRSVDREDDKRMLENLREAVNDAAPEELHLSRRQFDRLGSSCDKPCPATDHHQVLIARLVEMRRNFGIDAEETGTGGCLVCKAHIEQHGFGGLWKTRGEGSKVEVAIFAGNNGKFIQRCVPPSSSAPPTDARLDGFLTHSSKDENGERRIHGETRRVLRIQQGLPGARSGGLQDRSGGWVATDRDR